MEKRFIGDVHGKMDSYLRIVTSTLIPTIQVGDFGAGFVDLPELPEKDKWICGNHDNPALCREHPNWIPDGHFDGQIFFVGGAASIDRHRRVEGESWWADEQLDHADWFRVIDEYDRVKPSIVVSHDCPEPLTHEMRGYTDWNVSRTQQALTSMFSLHKPKLWLFGHYHRTHTTVIEGTKFQCLGELDYLDIELDDYR